MTEIIQYIEENLHEDLNVELVAGRSGYSSYHFQKMFAAVTGLSMGSYIRRRRLTKAAFSLGQSDARIIEIAMDAGFESQEAFTRAFKAMFGTNPGQFRERSLAPWMLAQYPLDEKFLQHLKAGGVSMEPKFIKHRGFHVMGLGKVFHREETAKIGAELWPEFIKRFHGIPNKQGGDGRFFKTYGVCQEALERGLLGDSFKYSAAVEVSPETMAPSGMELLYIPPQSYAVFTHTGSLQNLPKTLNYIWGVWLPKSGFKIAQSPDLEFYDADFDPGSADAKLEIWLPVENPPV